LKTRLNVIQAAKTGTPRYSASYDDPETSQIVGHRIGGAFAGPKLMVAADAPLAEAVFKRLTKLPTLPWMRGELWVINLTSFNEHTILHLPATLWETPIERTVVLPHVTSDTLSEEIATEAYWSVLRLCSDLGMISGRGVQMVGNNNSPLGGKHQKHRA